MPVNVDSEVESAWEREADRRQADIDSDGVALLSNDEVVSRLRQKQGMQDRLDLLRGRVAQANAAVSIGDELSEVDAAVSENGNIFCRLG